jgi:hypothetical protein
VVALGLVGTLFVLSRPPALSDQEAAELASRFQFTQSPLPELSGHRYKSAPAEMIRQIHPRLRRVAAFVSFTGAAVALADLDGDGLPNDLVSVDPRVDQVIVAPVPGTGNRFGPFPLMPAPLPFHSSTMAPTGSLVGDFDEDGLADILVYYWGRSPILFLQRPDRASPGLAVLSPERWIPHELVEPYQVWNTSAVTQADLDGDGHIDLIVGNYFRDGTGVLDAAATSPAELPDSLCRAVNGGRSRLFLWQGPGRGRQPSARFREAEGVLADDVASGWTLALGAADLDGDLLPEIYFVQDFGPDRLLHNRSQPGEIRFVLLYGERTLTTPRSSVLGRDTFNGMGMDFGDLNGDGVPDIFVSNITCNSAFDQTSFVFLSRKDELHRMRQGIAPYRNASEDLGLSRGGWNWEARLADFDNDGVLEVLQAAGATKGMVTTWPLLQETALMNDQLTADARFWHSWQPGDDVAGSDHSPFYVRAGDGRYYDLAPRIGLAEPMNSRGIATADVDGDGRLDFAMANQWGPSFFFHNTAPRPGAFLGLNLRLAVGPGATGATVQHPGRPRLETPSRPAIGASATVHLPDRRTLVAQVDGGRGHSGKRSPELHFGLGRLDPDQTDKLRVDLRWRGADGRIREETVSLEPDRWHTVLLGEVPSDQAGGRP